MGACVPLTVWDALRGGLATRALALAAEHGVAEALLGGPRSVDELAAGSGADPDMLNRLLRALASDRIFEEVEPGVYANTEASAMLTEDGWDAFARLFGGPWLQAIAALDTSGEASFPRVFGDEFWSWFRDHPEERALFDRAMEQGWQGRIERLDAVGFRGDETVVDVGGGNGSLLRALLDRHRELQGVVLDLPETVRDEASFGDRLRFEEGSFFDRVPPGDVFVLSTILHDWPDEEARAGPRDGARRRGVREQARPDRVDHPARERSRRREMARPADARDRGRTRAHGGGVARAARVGGLGACALLRERRDRGTAALVTVGGEHRRHEQEEDNGARRESPDPRL
jgi:hypothetical protein